MSRFAVLALLLASVGTSSASTEIGNPSSKARPDAPLSGCSGRHDTPFRGEDANR